ncbi:hypothetical protein H696_01035 [Fonticula alba]|uniref:Uncharacterized protein n=1 Tax=Fonticula alba TaxID=691883 RepID=A0A058ZCF8_FONAL|nr:hypothetical protein H696_01035 [Fonticula alba]KCV71618.1 hypothetical protein H696_01035 [Fonticula alba]|eukprot:XP_009493196.1 hypothetical protein H696_01035 [Fonticula alba]
MALVIDEHMLMHFSNWASVLVLVLCLVYTFLSVNSGADEAGSCDRGKIDSHPVFRYVPLSGAKRAATPAGNAASGSGPASAAAIASGTTAATTTTSNATPAATPVAEPSPGPRRRRN